MRKQNSLMSILASILVLAQPITLESIESRITPLPKKYSGPKTVGHYQLDAEQGLGALPSDYKRLETVISECTEKIRNMPKENPEQAVKVLETIAKTLKDEGFQTSAPADLLYDSLRSKKLDCDIYTTIYMSIAESVDIPLTAVINYPVGKERDGKIVPCDGHVFVRWTLPNKEKFNWECTSGRVFTDKYYQSTLGEPIPLTDWEKRLGYWQNTKLKEMSIDRFRFWAMETRLKFCENLFGPLIIEAYPITYQMILYKCNSRIKESPDNSELHMLRGDAHRGLNEYGIALEDYQTAYKLNPSEEIFRKRSHCWTVLEKLEQDK